MRAFRRKADQKRVAVSLLGIIDDASAVADGAAAAVRENARVLVVRNTVQQAIATQQALDHVGLMPAHRFSCNGRSCPHHGRFAAVDRKLLDARVEAVFGKGSASSPCILVGTQTLEQSLDIDADLLICDLCPMDVLLQRIGRLHRHRRSRPAGFETPSLIVLTPKDRDLSPFLSGKRGQSYGLGTVYENLPAIEATWRVLEHAKLLTIPDDNRALVEATTDSKQLESLAVELGPAWQARWGQLIGAAAAQAGEATARGLDWLDPFDSYEENIEIRTRLGDLPHLLRIPAVESPFGQELKELQIPHHFWPAGCNLEETDREELGEGRIRFQVGDRRFFYSELGLQRDS